MDSNPNLNDTVNLQKYHEKMVLSEESLYLLRLLKLFDLIMHLSKGQPNAEDSSQTNQVQTSVPGKHTPSIPSCVAPYQNG